MLLLWENIWRVGLNNFPASRGLFCASSPPDTNLPGCFCFVLCEGLGDNGELSVFSVLTNVQRWHFCCSGNRVLPHFVSLANKHHVCPWTTETQIGLIITRQLSRSSFTKTEPVLQYFEFSSYFWPSIMVFLSDQSAYSSNAGAGPALSSTINVFSFVAPSLVHICSFTDQIMIQRSSPVCQ